MAYSNVDMRVYKPLNQSRKIVQAKIMPIMEILVTDFGKERAQKVANLITRSDPAVVKGNSARRDSTRLQDSLPYASSRDK